MRRAALTLLLSLASIAIAPAANEIFAPAENVSFTISTERRANFYQEQVIVKYQITNVGRASLYVPRSQGASCLDGMHFNAWFVGQPAGPGPTLSERMKQSAILLRPGEHVDGTLIADPRWSNLPPGKYRIEAALWGWKEAEFSQAERNELAAMGNPFLKGEKHASIPITLTR